MDQHLNDDLPPDLARALGALDARAARQAARVEPARMAAAVTRALREPAAVGGARWMRPALRLAATLALLAGGAGIAAVVLRDGAPAPGAVAAVLPFPLDTAALTALSDSGVVAVHAALDSVHAGAATTSQTTVLLEELTEVELRALLQAMESTEESL